MPIMHIKHANISLRHTAFMCVLSCTCTCACQSVVEQPMNDKNKEDAHKSDNVVVQLRKEMRGEKKMRESSEFREFS